MIKLFSFLCLVLYQQTAHALSEVPEDAQNVMNLGQNPLDHPIKELLDQAGDQLATLEEYFSQFSEEELAELDEKVKKNYIEKRLQDGSKDPQKDRQVNKCWIDIISAGNVQKNRYARVIKDQGWQKAGIRQIDEKIWNDEIYSGKRDAKTWLLTVGKMPENEDPNRIDVLESALDRLICFSEHYGDQYNYGWIDWDTELVREALNLKDGKKDLNFLAVQDGKLYHKTKEGIIDEWIEFAANPSKFAAFTDNVPSARNSLTLYLSYAYNTLPRNIGLQQLYNHMQKNYNDTYAYQSIVKPLFSPLNRNQTIGFNIIVYILVPLASLLFLSFYLVLKLLCLCFCGKSKETKVDNSKSAKKDN